MTIENGDVTSYLYDADYRLTKADDYGTTSYTYTCNKANQLLKAGTPATATTPTATTSSKRTIVKT